MFDPTNEKAEPASSASSTNPTTEGSAPADGGKSTLATLAPDRLRELQELAAVPSDEDETEPRWELKSTPHQVEEARAQLRHELRYVHGYSERTVNRASLEQLILALYAIEFPESSTTTAGKAIALAGLKQNFVSQKCAEQHKAERAAYLAAPVGSSIASGDEYGIDGAEFMSMEFGDDAWLVHGLVPEGVPVVMAGLAKAGKSWIELYLALCIATGRPAFGRPTRKARVLLISREDRDRECKRRMLLLMRGLKIDPEDLRGQLRIDCQQPLYFDRADELAKLERTMVSFRPAAVFIDSLSRIHMQDENSRTEMSKVTNVWSDMCGRHNSTVVILHHVVKMAEGRSLMQKIRGTGDIPAVVRMGIGVEKLADGTVVIETDGNMADMAHEFKLRRVDYDAKGGKVVVEGAARHSIELELVGGTGAAAGGVDRLHDPVIGELVTALYNARLGNTPGVVTATTLHKRCGGKREVTPKLKIMMDEGIAEYAMQGKKVMGYQLTPAGVHFEEAGRVRRTEQRMPTVAELMAIGNVPVH